MAAEYVVLLEGQDDLAVLYHLLRHHGLPIAKPHKREPGKIALESAGSIEKLLASLKVQLKL